MKGSDPEGYRWHRHNVKLFEPPPGEAVHIDTTTTDARTNAKSLYETLASRGFSPWNG